jgi:co-chaperonin GroES (HSP10)
MSAVPKIEPRAKALASLSTSLAPDLLSDLTVEEAFPDVDCRHIPLHNTLIVQYPRSSVKSKGGLLLVEDTRATNQANVQVVKVISIGPVAFKNRETLEPWPEGAWCQVGDFVRVGKYTPDRWNIPLGPDEGVVMFGLIEDLNIRAKIIGNPLSVPAYV